MLIIDVAEIGYKVCLFRICLVHGGKAGSSQNAVAEMDSRVATEERRKVRVDNVVISILSVHGTVAVREEQ